MNVAITLKDQRPRHIRRVLGTAARSAGFGVFPWAVRICSQAPDRHRKPIPRAEQRRLHCRLVIDGEARLEVSRHAGQSTARATGSWADRANAGWWKPQARRRGHLCAVCHDVARHRRVQGEMYADSHAIRPMARKNTDTPAVSGWHACRVSSRRMMRFWPLTDTPAVSVERDFVSSLTRPPCRFIDIPGAASSPPCCFRWGEQALAVRRRAGDLTFLNVERPPRAAAEVSP